MITPPVRVMVFVSWIPGGVAPDRTSDEMRLLPSLLIVPVIVDASGKVKTIDDIRLLPSLLTDFDKDFRLRQTVSNELPIASIARRKSSLPST